MVAARRRPDIDFGNLNPSTINDPEPSVVVRTSPPQASDEHHEFAGAAEGEETEALGPVNAKNRYSIETRASHSQRMATDSSTPRRSARLSTIPRHKTNFASSSNVPAAASDADSQSDDEPIEIEDPKYILQPQLKANNGKIRSNFNKGSQKQTHFKVESLSPDVLSHIKLKVIASNQQNMAPITVRLSAYNPADNLFEFLAAECELGSKTKVTAVSATYSWNHSAHRLRKHKFDEDWKEFCDDLRSAWGGLSDPWESGLGIAMMLHVEE